MEGYRERLRRIGGSLTPAEHRAADLLAHRPSAVGFGTVAEVASAAGCGVATVARLAAKLGYSGFSELQREVRRDLSRQLRPAAERIRERPGGQGAGAGLLRDHLELELDNLRATLDAIDESRLARVVSLLADPERTVALVGGDATGGAVRDAADALASLRDAVVVLEGSPVAAQRRLALVDSPSVVVVCDVRRYDAWVLDIADQARADGHLVIAVTDSDLSPLAHGAAEVLVVGAAGVGPFDSATAMVSLLHLLVAGVAAHSTAGAQRRLERVEQAWSRRAALIDDPS